MELFQLCLQEATYFTMTVYPRCESDWKLVTFDRELEKRLDPYCIGKKHLLEGRWGNVMVETLPVEGTVGIYEDNEVLLDFVRHTPGIWHHWNADNDIKDGFRNPVEWEAI